MKIDIHTHTRKCKSGDAPTREITPEDFCAILSETDVGIIAITNHNVFDLGQFEAIEKLIEGEVQVWPGVELDVVDKDGVRGHLLVIASPKSAIEFSDSLSKMTNGSTPDDFTATIDEVISEFDKFSPIYVAHYKKAPMISESVLDALASGTRNPVQILKEVTNALSAGIYISHGHASIYGTDVHDWAKYKALSACLPDLRLPVDSFEHFCLLLKKDPTTITTLLDRKTSEPLKLKPFPDGTTLEIPAYNDINIIFGPKGTGKSCILKSISKHYSERGIDARVYESASDRLEEIFDVRGKDLSIDLNEHGIDYSLNEIEFIRGVVEVDVTSVSRYVAFYETTRTNKNAKKILIKELSPEEEAGKKRDFSETSSARDKIVDFLKFLSGSSPIKSELSADDFDEINETLTSLVVRLNARRWTEFLDWKETSMLNSAINKFRSEVSKKTGTPYLPTTTGFREYALNRIKIEICSTKISQGLNTKIPPQVEEVGSLGTSKGNLEYRTEFHFQTGSVIDSSLVSLTKVKKTPQKEFASLIGKISQNAYSSDLFQLIASLNQIEDVESIKTVHELLLFKRYFSLGGSAYFPSSGEASMLMLQKELGAEKEVYILDEPERSLGNEYISDVIVPMIKDRARAGKKIFISTHDANIAVRTLPYGSIYRCHDGAGYSTYIGNPFASDLVRVDDSTDRLDWREVSMRTLEGGREAFGERGNIYGRT